MLSISSIVGIWPTLLCPNHLNISVSAINPSRCRCTSELCLRNIDSVLEIARFRSLLPRLIAWFPFPPALSGICRFPTASVLMAFICASWETFSRLSVQRAVVSCYDTVIWGRWAACIPGSVAIDTGIPKFPPSRPLIRSASFIKSSGDFL